MCELGYIIDCSYELLESTPDIYTSLSFAYYFYGYDVEKKFYENPSLDTLSIMNGVENDILNLQKKCFTQEQIHYTYLAGLSGLGGQYRSFLQTIVNNLIEYHCITKMGIHPNHPFAFFRADEASAIINPEDMLHDFFINEAINKNKLQYWIQKNKNLFLKIQNSSIDFDKSIECYFQLSEKVNSFTYNTTEQIKKEKNNLLELEKPKNNHKKEIKKARKSIRRSINIFSNFFGQQPIKAFLQGNSFTAEGKYFNYIIKPFSNTNCNSNDNPSDIVFHTMYPNSINIPYSLEIVDKKTNLVLSNLCVVFPQTPIIDQILAILLHIKTDEENVLKTGVLFNVKNEFFNLNENQKKLFNSKPNPNQINLNTNNTKDELLYNEYKEKIISIYKKDLEKKVKKHIISKININDNFFDFLLKNRFSIDSMIESKKRFNKIPKNEIENLTHFLT